VQLQIFVRSYSTKGKGRGLGTYAMKLFTEKYLGGRIDFESRPETGTTFRVELPLQCPQQETSD
jgi:sensor histidine kinase regulating citrate/malate metabolism